MPLPLDGILCLDFEASAVGPGSYPIEAAVVDCASTASRSWLIRPTQAWLEDGVWSEASAAVHKLTLAELITHGEPAENVALELTQQCAGKIVLCDGGEHDWRWLTTLFAAIDAQPPFELRDYQACAWELACQSNRRPDIAIHRSEWEARARFPPIHRAAADARCLAEMVRLIAGWP
jgi:hypothetical protein